MWCIMLQEGGVLCQSVCERLTYAPDNVIHRVAVARLHVRYTLIMSEEMPMPDNEIAYMNAYSYPP